MSKPSDREHMLAKAKAVLERVEIERADYTGSCEDCIYSRHVRYGKDRCVQPIVQAASFLVPQGNRRDYNQQCDYQRGDSNSNHWGEILCGPNGALFEPREKEPVRQAPSFWQSLKGLLR